MVSSGDGVAEIHGFSLGAKFGGLIAGIILQRHRSTPVALGSRVVDLGHGGPAGRPGGGRPIQGLQQTLLGGIWDTTMVLSLLIIRFERICNVVCRASAAQ